MIAPQTDLSTEISAKPVTGLALEVRGLQVAFPTRDGVVTALDGLSMQAAPGEIIGLVGESGCGKSTAGRAVLRLYEATAGSVTIDGDDISTLSAEALRKKRPMMQMVFQDPQASLNPRMTVAGIIGEPLDEHTTLNKAEKLARIYELMDAVGLNRDFANRYPHELSGGQRQRVGIARAIALRPEFILADEIVSGLDVSSQAQVLTLLEELAALNMVGMDCVEVAPAYDHAELTSSAAATFVWTYLCGQVAKPV